LTCFSLPSPIAQLSTGETTAQEKIRDDDKIILQHIFDEGHLRGCVWYEHYSMN
jgi:hypothetical protein